MDWKCYEFRELSSIELYLILRARNAVLVVEDAHVHLDIDGKDEHALHVFALDADGGEPSVSAYARLMPGDDVDPEAMIDKFLTSAARRDDDTANQLLEHALAAARERWPDTPVRINSPIYHEAFYERFGFRKVDGPFLEHGMPYIGMVHSTRGATKSSVRNLLRAVRGSAADSVTEPVAQPAEPAGSRAPDERYAFSPSLPADSGVNR
jgi:predicted GNAT family N-acyltransferase